MNTAIVNDQENAGPTARSLGKNVLGAKRSLSGRPTLKNDMGRKGGLGKKKLGGLSSRRALGDISNGNTYTAPSKGTVKTRPSRPIPRDEFGRIEEPEYLPVHSPMQPPIVPPKIDLFADDDYGPAAPDSVRSVDARHALFDLQPAVVPQLGVKDYSAIELDFNGLVSATSLFSEDELIPLHEFPDLQLGSDFEG